MTALQAPCSLHVTRLLSVQKIFPSETLWRPSLASGLKLGMLAISIILLGFRTIRIPLFLSHKPRYAYLWSPEFKRISLHRHLWNNRYLYPTRSLARLAGFPTPVHQIVFHHSSRSSAQRADLFSGLLAHHYVYGLFFQDGSLGI